MNRQVNPDHCYTTDDGVVYMLVAEPGTPEWHVFKDGRPHQTFTSLMAAKGWLEHVLEHPVSDQVRAIADKVADRILEIRAKLNGGAK